MKERRETAGSRRKRVASLLEKQVIDYKNPQLLRHFLTDRGKIIPARVSGLSARDQRRLTRAVKRARMLALLPYTSD